MSSVAEYSRIQSEYASYSSGTGIGSALEETEQALKPLRAKTAPAEDLELERRKLVLSDEQSLVLVQFALFLLVLALLSFVFLSITWASAVTFLLLCVGIGVGFFLRR